MPRTQASHQRDSSLSYGDKQSLLRQALIAEYVTGDDDGGLYVEDFGDDWVVFYVYGLTDPGPGDWQLSYSIDADGVVTFAGDATPVVPKTSFLPAPEAKAMLSDLVTTVQSLRSAVEQSSHPDRAGVAVIRSEPLTYDKLAPVSYFRDLFFASDPNLRQMHPDAQVRLHRHAAELAVMASEPNSREARAYQQAGLELRAPNLTPGTGGWMTAPLWLIEQFATAARPARVLADLIPGFTLPAGYSSVSVPRVVTGTAEQPTQPNSPAGEADITDSASQHGVNTISGISDWPLQALEQSPAGAHIDWVVFKDMSEAYDSSLEYQLISAVINAAASSNQVTYTSGSPTLAGMYGPLGQLAAAIGKNRRMPPEAWLMTTARWAWVGSSLDSANRPVVTPDVHPPHSDDNKTGAVSTDLGFAVYCDDAIPTNLGAGANQDVIIACRPSDMLLFEGAPQVQTSREPLSGSLGVRFRMYRNVDMIVDRYPTAIATLTGTGMVTQPGY